MNAVMTQAVASDPIQRYDASRRRNAESAYNRNVQYNGQNQKTVEDLEALLIGKKEPEDRSTRATGTPEAWRGSNEADCATDWKDA